MDIAGVFRGADYRIPQLKEEPFHRGESSVSFLYAKYNPYFNTVKVFLRLLQYLLP